MTTLFKQGVQIRVMLNPGSAACHSKVNTVIKRQELVEGKWVYSRASSLRRWWTHVAKTILTMGHRQGFLQGGKREKKE